MVDTGIWVAPLLLIPAVGLLVLSTSARFGQVHDEYHRHRSEGETQTVRHLCKRARLIHSALVSFYMSIAALALASLFGTVSARWFDSVTWVAQGMTFVGVTLILFSSVQLIRESKLLITVILDDVGQKSIS